MPAENLAPWIIELRAWLEIGKLQALPVTLRNGSVVEDAQAAVQLMLDEVDEYRAMKKAQREQEPWRSLRHALEPELFRLREVLL